MSVGSTGKSTTKANIVASVLTPAWKKKRIPLVFRPLGLFLVNVVVISVGVWAATRHQNCRSAIRYEGLLTGILIGAGVIAALTIVLLAVWCVRKWAKGNVLRTVVPAVIVAVFALYNMQYAYTAVTSYPSLNVQLCTHAR